MVTRRMLEGEIEHTAGAPASRWTCSPSRWWRRRRWTSGEVGDLHDVMRRAYPYRDLSREQFEGVLEMLAGRYPSRRVRGAAAADRLGPDRRHHPRPDGAKRLAVVSEAPFPTAACTGCFWPTPAAASASSTRRWCTRRGRARSSSWERLMADRRHHPRPGAGLARARRARQDAVLEGRRPWAGPTSWAWPSARRSRTPRRFGQARRARGLQPGRLPRRPARRRPGSLPDDRTLVAERFRDELGRLADLPAVAVRRPCPRPLGDGGSRPGMSEELDLEVEALWSDDGIAIRLPDSDRPPPIDLVRDRSRRARRHWC